MEIENNSLNVSTDNGLTDGSFYINIRVPSAVSTLQLWRSNQVVTLKIIILYKISLEIKKVIENILAFSLEYKHMLIIKLIINQYLVTSKSGNTACAVPICNTMLIVARMPSI